MKIYIIFHDTLETPTVFTTDRKKVMKIILMLATDTSTAIHEWNFSTLNEHESFWIDMQTSDIDSEKIDEKETICEDDFLINHTYPL